jgi:predicted nucleotidyltransferase
MKKLDMLICRRADERRRTARERVAHILRDAQIRGVEISVVGSLARDRFQLHSDIDLLVHGTIDPARRAMVERLIADHLRGTDIPYDLIFACDIPHERAQELLHDSL